MRIEKFEKMSLYVLSEERAKREDFNYRYLVSHGAYNHNAFKTLAGLNYWLLEHGLKVNSKIEDDNRYEIEGVYFEICLFRIEPTMPNFSNFHNEYCWDESLLDTFGRKNNLMPSFIMNNGSWTRSYVYKGKSGLSEIGLYDEEVTVIYYLNPNCKQNKYDYRQFHDEIPNNPQILVN